MLQLPFLLVTALAVRAAETAPAARPRPHISAGFGCSLAHNSSEYLDYRWDALDSVHFHDAVAFVANGSTVRSSLPSCDFPHGPLFTSLRAHARASGVQLWLSTGNSGFGAFGPAGSDEIIRFLTDDAARWRAINSSLDAVELGQLDGLSLDIEGDWRFNQSVREPHSRFVMDLAAAGRSRTPPIPIRYPIFWDIYKDAAVDLVAVTNVTDATTIMAYDYHWCAMPTSAPVRVIHVCVPVHSCCASVYGIRLFHRGGDGRAGPNCPLVNCNLNCSGDVAGANVERTVRFAHSLSQGSAPPGGGAPRFLLGIGEAVIRSVSTAFSCAMGGCTPRPSSLLV